MKQIIKKGVKFQNLEKEAEYRLQKGYQLVCLMPEMVHTYNVGGTGGEQEYTLPTLVTCVFLEA